MDVNVEDGLFRYHIAMTIKFQLDNNISSKRYTQCESRPNNFGRKQESSICKFSPHSLKIG
jgi:hypothetical protein